MLKACGFAARDSISYITSLQYKTVSAKKYRSSSKRKTARQYTLDGAAWYSQRDCEPESQSATRYLLASSKSAGRTVSSTRRMPARTSPGSACRPTSCLEKTNSPLTVTSKTPPVAGISFQLLMKNSISRSFKISSVKLTALGWCPQVAQYLTTMSIPPSCMRVVLSCSNLRYGNCIRCGEKRNIAFDIGAVSFPGFCPSPNSSHICFCGGMRYTEQ